MSRESIFQQNVCINSNRFFLQMYAYIRIYFSAKFMHKFNYIFLQNLCINANRFFCKIYAGRGVWHSPRIVAPRLGLPVAKQSYSLNLTIKLKNHHNQFIKLIKFQIYYFHKDRGTSYPQMWRNGMMHCLSPCIMHYAKQYA